MRVLIFPTDTGDGHNRASKALKEYLDAEGVDTLIMDVLDTDRKKSDFVSKLYDDAVNHVPSLFGALYGFAERISSSKRHSPIYYLNALYGGSLQKVINDFQPQVIVCPHMFSAHSVSRLIAKYDLNIPTLGIITDYTCSPFWEETLLNRYVVAHKVVADECISKGMNKDRLIPFGIPVSSKFKVKLTKEKARAAFGIRKEKVFVIMGGSMGYGKIPELAAELSRRVPDAQILAVCGRNEAVLKKIKSMQGVIALGYIDNIDIVMDSADVILTKPGGLSTTEVMTKRVPLVITLPIPGGEVRNSAIITKLGMAISANTVKDAADAACALLMDGEAQAKMIAAQEHNCSQTAAEDTCKLIIEMASYREGRLC